MEIKKKFAKLLKSGYHGFFTSLVRFTPTHAGDAERAKSSYVKLNSSLDHWVVQRGTCQQRFGQLVWRPSLDCEAEVENHVLEHPLRRTNDAQRGRMSQYVLGHLSFKWGPQQECPWHLFNDKSSHSQTTLLKLKLQTMNSRRPQTTL